MPKDRLEKARFERVSETGDLVFSLGGRQFAVSLDDTLERAILEAKQVRSEQQQPEQPHEQSTLPISQIQSLIRAGADPSRVAERYGLSTTLVRRFSAAVETEKQYAIEQFLTVPAPKDSKVRTINELVERTLAAASIGMESVTWKSTRRGLEPWHIVAIFTSAGREIHAEWTWNMHDNSVVCLNNAARKLLGEQNPRTENAGGAKASPEPALPGDSVRSARIERAVSAWAAPKPSAPQTHSASSNPVTSTGSMPPIDLSASGSMPPVKLSAPVSTGAASTQTPPDDSRIPAAQSDAPAHDEVTSDSGAAPVETGKAAKKEQTAAPAKAAPAEPAAKPSRRKSGRSAVPSWDEILFGD
ncbi:septation protein SepH [Bifidobacterium breve]|uniref:septation protein SepH n=1 Tax=Bifidobacterium breve TaxID=1685 RepID=UPI002B9A9358|nr:septation protein SepH [Bifidobacterium breve]MEB3518596.1 septation protein SepH [Bifidobacterium breve]